MSTVDFYGNWPLIGLIAAGVLVAIVVFAVLYNLADDRECVRGHFMPIIIGNVVSLIWICDEYEETE